MLRSMSPLLAKRGLCLLVLSGAVLSVAAAVESKASENVVTVAVSSLVRVTQGVFDLAKVAQDYELALATAQKQGVAGEQFFWFHFLVPWACP